MQVGRWISCKPWIRVLRHRALAVWDPTYLHLAPAVYVPIAATVDKSLSGNTNVMLLGPYGARDAGVEIIRCCKKVYVPAPYGGILLCADITPVEEWNRLHGAIVDAATKAACRPLIDWLRAAIVRSSPNTHSTLVVPEPSAPFPDTLLLQHCHWLLLIHLPKLEPSINRAAGTCIVEIIGKVTVELMETRLENKRVKEKNDNKGATEYFGANLAHLLNLIQVTYAKDIPPIWEALARASKHQQLLVLQRTFDTAA